MALGADQLERVDLACLVALHREEVDDPLRTVADPLLLQPLPDDAWIERGHKRLAVVANIPNYAWLAASTT